MAEARISSALRSSVEDVNASLRTLGYDYQIDTSTDQTMADGLQTIGAYPPSQRNLIMEQMNLIIQQRNYGAMFDAERNKFRSFLEDMSPTGFGIEDIFHELIDGIDPLWDDKENTSEVLADMVGYDNNTIDKNFHVTPFSRQFKSTIDRRNYEKVFTEFGVTRFVDTKLANLSWSAEKYLQSTVIGVIQDMIANGDIVSRYTGNVNSPAGVNAFVEDVKAVTSGFLTPSNSYNIGAYNAEGEIQPIVNMTDSEDNIFVITTPEFMARLKVQGYSNAFNLSQYELEGRILYAPAGTKFGTITDEKHGSKPVQMVVVDRRAILIGLSRWAGSSFFVPNTFITNNWLTVEGIKGYNTWFNAVALTSDAIDTFHSSEIVSTVIVRGSNFLISADDVENISSYEDEAVYRVTGDEIKVTYTGDGTWAYSVNGQSVSNNVSATIPVVSNSVILIQ